MPREIIEESNFGQTKDGKKVKRYTLSSDSGRLLVRIITYGGIITEVHVPDRNGKMADINLGYDDVAGYETYDPYIGALIGRVANRVSGGKFVLDGVTYNLPINDIKGLQNQVHGGKSGFCRQVWTSRIEGDKLILQYVSPDGEEGYPGEVITTVTYRVTDDDELSIQYEATTTKPTPVVLTNHAYFNLAGHDANTLDDHLVTIAADHYLPLKSYIPTGEIRSVEGTAYDLRKPVKLGERLPQVPGGEGFETEMCLRPNPSGEPRFAARVEHPPTGRYCECWTTEPGIVFYTSSVLNVPKAKGGATYRRFGALSLEPQAYPDAVNQPSFPNTILRPGETYRQTTFYKFGVV
ncbi:hypothetical protein BaRGS_00001890 [Batillaria attramentaria]|uniref:Aldose 1-epimerase n=1 Tax=Batillaria attramentaria TaxID=370345 RepID=A0ABD0M6J5_9CAEN